MLPRLEEFGIKASGFIRKLDNRNHWNGFRDASNAARVSNELEEVGISFEKIPEGNCLNVRNLHFDALISQENERQLCGNLMAKQRVAQRCKKAQTILILQHQQDLGCKATDNSSQSCSCEVS